MSRKACTQRVEAVRSGAADLGLTYVDELPDAISGEALQARPSASWCPHRHRLAARRTVALAELRDVPRWHCPAIRAPGGRWMPRASVAGLTLRQIVIVNQFATLMGCVARRRRSRHRATGATGLFSAAICGPFRSASRNSRVASASLSCGNAKPSPAAAGFLALARRLGRSPRCVDAQNGIIAAISLRLA